VVLSFGVGAGTGLIYLFLSHQEPGWSLVRIDVGPPRDLAPQDSTCLAGSTVSRGL
jgi:hypothetical protein